MTVTEQQIAFETLIYTDCVPGQGLRGTAGLQFQARSPAADPEAMAVVQRSLLYEPPAAWMRERRPTEEYPISFGHIWDGLYATAAGLYLGREANGGREGNQLTHSVVTRDPDSYGLTRPAQLCQAPFWLSAPEPTTTCPPIAAGWEPGPFTADAAQAFVNHRPDGAKRLCALLSALDRIGDADARRVLFIAEDPIEVLRWIAAATLLIPQRQALTIGLKVFSTNPAYAPQPVVAVHPDWENSSVSVDNDGGYFVFDLTTGRHTEIEPTPLAERRVDLLARRDPYDVVDLIEVVALVDRPPPVAFDLGVAMVMPDGPLPEALAREAVVWLRDTEPDVLAPYRGGLVDRLVEDVERWPSDILAALDQVAARGQVPVDRVAPIRLALIRAEIDKAVRGQRSVEISLSPLPDELWGSDARRGAEDQVVTALCEADGRADAMDRLLRAAKRLGVRVRLEDAPDVVSRFIDDWVNHPRYRFNPGAWARGGELDGQLRDALSWRIEDGDGDWVGDSWWEVMSPSLASLDSALDHTILAATMRHGDDPRRRDLVRRYVSGAHRTGRADPIRRVVDTLWSRTPIRDAELDILCEVLPDGPALPPNLFEPLLLRLVGGEPLSHHLLSITRRLVEHELFAAPSVVRDLLQSDHHFQRICAQLPSDPDRQLFEADLRLIQRAEPRVAAMWAPKLTEALLRVTNLNRIVDMTRTLPEDAYRLYIDRLLANLGTKHSEDWVLVAVCVAYGSRTSTERDRERLRRAMITAVGRLGDRKRKSLAAQVAKLDRAMVKGWAEIEREVEEAAKKRWRLFGSREGKD